MKKISFIFSILVFAFLASCSKDAADPVYPIEGYWTGKFGLATNVPNTDMVMAIEPNGKAVLGFGTLSSGAYSGTWTLSGNIFKAAFTLPVGPITNTYTYQATFSNKGKLESGTVGPGSSTTGYGTFFMDRKN